MEQRDSENKKYKLERLKSASDLEALILLYDEAISSLEDAKRLFAEQKKEEGVASLRFVGKIVKGLAGILDFRVDARLATNLYKIYDYLVRRLEVAETLVRQTPDIIDEVRQLLTQLRESWVVVKEKGDVTANFRMHLTSEQRSFLNIQI